MANGVKEAANNAAAAMHQLADDAANALEVIGNYLVEKGKQMLAAGLDTVPANIWSCCLLHLIKPVASVPHLRARINTVEFMFVLCMEMCPMYSCMWQK